MRSLYFTLINPYFEYCNIIWAISSSGVLDDLFRLQKRAIRLVTNSVYKAHTAPLFLKLNVLKVYQINHIQVASFMYRVKNKLLPQYFNDMFISNSSVHGCYTRQHNNLHVSYHRLVVTSNSIRVHGVIIWNSIPENLKNANSLKIFRTNYKQILFNSSRPTTSH